MTPLRPKPTHMQVSGATQKGKTTYGNKVHRRFPRISVFVDTKGIDPIWGLRVKRLDNIAHVLPVSQKIIYDPPRADDGIVWDRADAEIQGLWSKVQRVARQSNWQPGRDDLWFQAVFDEAGKWQDEKDASRPRTLEDMSERALGMGGRVVTLQQHPGTLGTHTRNNLDTRVVYGLGDEGRRCIRSWGWPEPQITPWTAQPYHFATYHPALGWRLHCPTPSKDACSTCGRTAGEGPRTLGAGFPA